MKKLLVIPSDIVEEYNTDKLVKWTFTDDGLDELRRVYHSVKGQPRFIHDFLSLGPSRHKHGVVTMPEGVYHIFDEGKVLLMPNPRHTDHDALLEPGLLKDRDGGFALVTWAVHPEQVKSKALLAAMQSGDSEAIRQAIIDSVQPDMEEDGAELNTVLRYGNPAQRKLLSTLPRSSSWSKQLTRADSQQVIEAIEFATDSRIYASILDLTFDDIPMLEKMRDEVKQNLKDVYGVTDADTTRLYFHFPYAEVTVTLHLHIRVNQGLHPVEGAKIFYLDEIIEALRKGKSIKELILERGGVYGKYGTITPLIQNVPGCSADHVPNPMKVAVNSDGVGMEHPDGQVELQKPKRVTLPCALL